MEGKQVSDGIKLRPHQKEGIKFILSRTHSGLFLPTGMGKTLIALIYLHILDTPALIVAPASMKRVWLEENMKFKINLNISTDYRMPGKIVLVSYDWLKYNEEVIDEYDTVVLDEGKLISDTETVRYKNMSGRLRSRKRLVILAGYPIENKLTEIFGQISLISDVLGDNYYHFLYKYFTVVKHKGRIVRVNPKHGSLEQIVEKISSIVFVSDKSKVVSVKKEVITRRFVLSDYQIDMIESLTNTGVYSDDKVSIRCKHFLVVFTKVMQIISGFVYNIDDNNELYPVFFAENPKLDLLRRTVGERSNFLLWHFFDAERDILKEFSRQCKLCKLQTDSRGLNLQSYDFAAYYTIPLSGGQFLQSVDRMHRIGRKRDVISIVLAPEGDFGDRLLAMMTRKRKLTHSFIKELLGSKLR